MRTRTPNDRRFVPVLRGRRARRRVTVAVWRGIRAAARPAGLHGRAVAGSTVDLPADQAENATLIAAIGVRRGSAGPGGLDRPRHGVPGEQDPQPHPRRPRLHRRSSSSGPRRAGAQRRRSATSTTRSTRSTTPWRRSTATRRCGSPRRHRRCSAPASPRPTKRTHRCPRAGLGTHRLQPRWHLHVCRRPAGRPRHRLLGRAAPPGVRRPRHRPDRLPPGPHVSVAPVRTGTRRSIAEYPPAAPNDSRSRLSPSTGRPGTPETPRRSAGAVAEGLSDDGHRASPTCSDRRGVVGPTDARAACRGMLGNTTGRNRGVVSVIPWARRWPARRTSDCPALMVGNDGARPGAGGRRYGLGGQTRRELRGAARGGQRRPRRVDAGAARSALLDDGRRELTARQARRTAAATPLVGGGERHPDVPLRRPRRRTSRARPGCRARRARRPCPSRARRGSPRGRARPRSGRSGSRPPRAPSRSIARRAA